MKIKKSLYSRSDILEMAKIVSSKHNVCIEAVMAAYESFYDNIRKRIADAELDKYNGESTYDSILSFNIKHLGKLYTTGNVVNLINEKTNNKNNESIEH